MVELYKEFLTLQKRRNSEASDIVVRFIFDFRTHLITQESSEIIRRIFKAGYCYYFAVMLRAAFPDGEICWTAPYGHFAYVIDGVPYDIEGVCTTDFMYLIPERYIKEGLDDFKHINGVDFDASQEYLDNAMQAYKEDLLKAVKTNEFS